MPPRRSRSASRGPGRCHAVMLALASLAAGGPVSAATTADETVGAEDLRSLVRPLTKEELEAEAAAWRDLLKAKVAEISRLRVGARQARTDAAADPAVESPETKETAAAITRLQEERTLLGDRLRLVLDEWEKKGGDPAEYRTYATAVSGLEIAANDVRDAGSMLALLTGWLLSEQGGIRWLWNIARFLAILAAFWVLARVLSSLVGQAVGRFRGASMLLRNFLVTFVRQAIMLIGFVVALSALEINTNPLLALIGGAAFVVGLALQGTLANFAHGLLILAYRPYDEGDFIDAGGVSGTVQSMNMLSTTIRTPDNKKVIVPNAKIGGDTITNATGTDTRRVDLTFGIGYDSDIDAAQAVLERIVADHPAVLRDPAPVVRLHQLADSSVNFVVRPWTKTADYWSVYWDITREVKRRFDAAGITIPYPQQDVHIHHEAPAARGTIAGLLVAAAVTAAAATAAEPVRHDIVVYGATSGGIVAAIQARAAGKSVIVVEPGSHVGGLTAGGLGATDIGNKAAIGGLSREFYRRIGRHYAADAAWTHESRETYQSRRKGAGEEEMWTFEPHVAERVYRDWLAEADVEVVFRARLDLGPGGVEKDGRRIVAFRAEDGRRFPGRIFIDATYEGDLMAKSGVSYHVGREAESVYGESLNGVRVAHATSHQFTHDVDPYVVPGDPQSGLVPLVSPGPPGADGTGDRRVQAYNFRMCTTDVPENRRAWPRPEGYDEREFELLLRNFEAGDHRVPWNPVWMPNRKTDTNNNFAISTDYIGANDAYPEAGHEEREGIVADHRRYQQGLMWTLANHPRVPAEVRGHFERLGLAKDEFVDNDNWPHQLYVREARRMVSDYVMTQHDCQWRRAAEDPVGLGAYNMDSHNCQRYVTDRGVVRNEGDVQVRVKPYGIAWRSIRPRREECENLLVPVCLAASHIAYGSIRMEPVFMVLGQSAATAAVLALERDTAVQDVDYAVLRERLRADGQVLEWTGDGRGRDDRTR